MDSPIPFKKPRLDYCVGNNYLENSKNSNLLSRKDNTGNELWGDDDFTAEEFDLLQSQVSSQMIPNTNVFENKNDELQKLKEQNYALEGQIKMLRNSLEQNLKELDKERLEKMSLIENYYDQQKEQQKSFNKIKEQLETQLNFKDHELRTTVEKLTILQQKGKSSAEISPVKIANNFSVVDTLKNSANKTESFAKHSKNFNDKNLEELEENKCYKLKLWSKSGHSVLEEKIKMIQAP
ncbi:interaptin-like [Centruroides sculpturatus]|uniref:interaptin-like n=1 Tax=Centruroides sculpturatus TaxID=218467 RepID=UPI000C6E134A|nr:interaptin-like [Centruroides sculpturatus]